MLYAILDEINHFDKFDKGCLFLHFNVASSLPCLLSESRLSSTVWLYPCSLHTFHIITGNKQRISTDITDGGTPTNKVNESFVPDRTPFSNAHKETGGSAGRNLWWPRGRTYLQWVTVSDITLTEAKGNHIWLIEIRDTFKPSKRAVLRQWELVWVA